jgi:hypothetical protein
MLKKSEIKLKLLSDGAKDLGEYFRKYKDYNNYLAILQGASHNLTRYGAGNPNLTRWSHPNIMLPNLTEGTFADHSAIAPLTDAFESSLVTHINALHDASPIATTYFSTKTIRNMCAVAASKKIPKISFGDKQGYLLIISDSQMAQLKKDTEYTAAWHSIASMNPTITGIGEGFYEGCWIIVSADVPSVKTTLADVQGNGEFLASTNAECMLTGTSNLADAARIQYGLSIPTFFENAIDAGPYKCAILLGRSALACGYGDKLSFESETWDFKAKKEDAAMMTFGTMRTDILDSDGYFDSGFKENTSSLVCVTYSPLTLSWS